MDGVGAVLGARDMDSNHGVALVVVEVDVADVLRLVVEELTAERD